MICTRNKLLLSSPCEKLKKVNSFYVSLVFPDSYIFSAAYAIAIRSSEYELSPPMLGHIVNQVVSDGTETSEEPVALSRQKRLGDVGGSSQ
jgi:hypothetical protein